MNYPFTPSVVLTGLAEVMRRVGTRLRTAALSRIEHAVRLKERLEIVTDSDLWAEQELSAALRTLVPGATLLGEESADGLLRESGRTLRSLLLEGYVWVIDPIDGTNNFANHIPHFATSIALLKDGEPILAAVYDPMRDDFFSACHGMGAYLNNTQLKVSTCKNLRESIIAVPFPAVEKSSEFFWPTIERVVSQTRASRVGGSAVLDICWVADGRLDGAILWSVQPWDLAAGTLLVREAGGICSNFPEAPSFDFLEKRFVFTSPDLKAPLFETLNHNPIKRT